MDVDWSGEVSQRNFLLNLIFKNNLKIICYTREKREHFKDHEEHVQNRQKGKAYLWKVPQKQGHWKYLQNGGEWRQGYSETFQVPQNLENTAKESENFPTTHELQAIRMDAGCKQPVEPNQYNPANYQPCL